MSVDASFLYWLVSGQLDEVTRERITDDVIWAMDLEGGLPFQVHRGGDMYGIAVTEQGVLFTDEVAGTINLVPRLR